jgi:catechol 2,3-dioxygenase-like lactoylglutathione lyase family enzyme
MIPSMKFICPLVTVSDMERSREFYENILGQTVRYDFGENISFEGDFAIHLRSHFQQLIDNRVVHSRANNFELYFEHDDLEPVEERLNNFGVEFVHTIREQPWRQRVMRFYDPDGNMIEVGESLEYSSYRLHLEGMDLEEISQTISMTVDFVKDAVSKFEQVNRRQY